MVKFLKFAMVGAFNTLVDLSVLNVLIYLFSIEGSGPGYVIAKGLSFSCAVIVSYRLNKRYVFGNSGVRLYERGTFALISVTGLAVNTLTSTLVFGALTAAKLDLPVSLLATVGGLAGTAAVLLWNFFGYKNFVFRTATAEMQHE